MKFARNSVMRREMARRLAGFLLGMALVAPMAREAMAAQVDPLPFVHDNTRLRVRIEERWRVIPLQGGLLLVPRRPSSLFKGVEIVQDGSIAIDGQTVTGADLQSRLGPDAEAVLRLSYLSPAERVGLFDAPATEPVERGAKGAAGQGAGRASGAGSAAGRGGGPWTEVLPVVRGDRFRFGGDAIVEESEQVTNVTSVLGAAVIDGVVLHDVVVIGGDVRLGPKSAVRGSITTVGGVLRADPGARVFGQVNELSFDNANLRVWWPQNGEADSFNVGITPDWPRITRVAFYGGLLLSAVWLVLSAAAFVIAPGAVSRARESIGKSPIGSFAAGFATQVLFVPITAMLVAVLAMSVIGIPLIALVPLAMFALFLGALFGSTAVFVAVGERLVGRAMPLLALLAGGMFVFGVAMTGRYLWMHGGGAMGWGFALACVGLVVEYVAITIGLGGAVLAWTRRITWRRKRAATSSLSVETPVAPVGPPLQF
jgi:hypothetical protein